MSRYRLTVAIPTYNRPGPLKKTLRSVLPQVVGNSAVQLVVLDNCSDIPARDVLADALNGETTVPDNVCVIRHPANIGGVFNILRCFEVAEGDWVWCLSDDDAPVADAVKTILADCDAGDHCYAYYGLKPGVPNVSDCADGRYVGDSIAEWVRRVPHYGHRLFISESVFRVADMRPFMSLAHLVASSGAPHLTLAYCAISRGGRYLLSRKQIAGYLAPEGGMGYNFSRLACGTSLLGMVRSKGTERDFRLFFRDSYQDWISPSMFLRHALSMYGNMSAGDFFRQFSLIAKIMKPSMFRRPRGWFKWSVCQLMSAMPWTARRLLKVK